MVVGRPIKSYGDDTGQVKNQEASTGLKRMVGDRGRDSHCWLPPAQTRTGAD
jgi:hypothetical protein